MIFIRSYPMIDGLIHRLSSSFVMMIRQLHFRPAFQNIYGQIRPFRRYITSFIFGNSIFQFNNFRFIIAEKNKTCL